MAAVWVSSSSAIIPALARHSATIAMPSSSGATWSIGRSVLDGLASAGVVGIVKHMPGHGRALVDSHTELPVVTASALHDDGVDSVWEQVMAHRTHLGQDGLRTKRAEQQLDFTWALVRDELDQRLKHSAGVKAIRDEVRAEVLSGELPATVAADRILAAYDKD